MKEFYKKDLQIILGIVALLIIAPLSCFFCIKSDAILFKAYFCILAAFSTIIGFILIVTWIADLFYN